MSTDERTVEEGRRLRPYLEDWFGRYWHLLAIAFFTIIFALYITPPAAASHLRNDLGVQLHLSIQTAQGAIPIIDFDHGWNAGGWYVGALMYRLVGNDPGLWMIGWLGVTAMATQAIGSAWIADRAGLSRTAVAAVAVACAFVLRVPNGKYATPVLWVAAVVWARERAPRTRWVVYGITSMIMFWLHVELAVLCSVGTVLAEAAPSARRLDLRRAIAAAASIGIGLAVALGLEIAFYAAQGLAPGDLLHTLIGVRTGTDSPQQFGWLLGQPQNIVAAFFPMLLLAPFVPFVFERTSPTTRLVTFVNLALALVAMRRADPAHLAAMGSMLPLAVGLVLTDLGRAADDIRFRINSRSITAAVGGGAWALATVLIAFNARGFFIVGFLVVSVLVGMHVGSRLGARGWSAAAAVILVLVGVAGVANREREEYRTGSTAYPAAEAFADLVGPLLRECTDGGDQVFILPGPPIYYETLDVENPTTQYNFFYGAGQNIPDLDDRIDRGEFDGIVVVGGMPASMAEFQPIIDENFELCDVPQIGDAAVFLYAYTGSGVS